ncbi:PAS domain S-box protein [Mucilaginibacter terrigena]|uniref:histidine kinase n=1 Tax=Mucilaginibacter terrigena TaxID=2492395 RepID=A0A4Q5LJX1_9SPHI|nr:PAS domain S-box protein [Mucilaginibacter terrigena]RYU89614.1 PAS domain S-box protein [Mucilaginibacter terrigena]
MTKPHDKPFLNDQAIAANEQRFRALVTATSDIIYSMSADWRVMRQLDGRGFLQDTREPTTHWQSKNIYPEDQEKVSAAINDSIRKKKIFELEHRVLRIDGTPGWTFSRAVPILDENGEIIEWFGTASDITERKQAEEALREAKERSEQQKRLYETITSGTPDLMYVFGLDYRFVYANSALLNMWGKTWENAVGKSLLENGYEPWHAEMHEREIDQVKATKQPVRGEVSFPHATLGRRVYDYILTPVFDEHGEVEAVAGTTRDVTERKQWEQSLAQSSEKLQAINEEMMATNEEQAASNEELIATNEELAMVNKQLLEARQKIEEGEVALRLAINAANFGTWFIHSVTREFITNARSKELFGYYSDEDLSIEQALAQITEEYRGFVATKLENAIYHNGDYDVTYPVIGLHDQRLRWLRAIGNLKADPSGTFSAFTGVVMDITEQYLAALKVERAEESLRMAVDAAGLGTYFINATDRIFYPSPTLKEFFGFRPDEEVPYEAAINQIHPEYRQKVIDMVEAAFKKGERFDMEYPVIGHHDGNTRWVRGIGTMQHYDGKDFFTGVLHDITERKQDEMRKNDFIGMVSHELKTPLTSLNAIIQVASAKLKTSDDAFLAGAMTKANAQVKRMSTMINGFLNVSRLEDGKIMIEKSHFNIQELVQEITEELKLSVTNHHINLFKCAPIVVYADRDKINSVISNLISNAVKYSPNNTTVKVSCAVTENEITVSVCDEGIGIKPSDTEKIFDRYFRVESSNTCHISGFGIGLYLSAEIVERHGGRIWVESEPDKGSTFYFSLPL